MHSGDPLNTPSGHGSRSPSAAEEDTFEVVYLGNRIIPNSPCLQKTVFIKHASDKEMTINPPKKMESLSSKCS